MNRAVCIKIVLLVLFSITCGLLKSQVKEADSLANLLEKHKDKDSIRVKLLIEQSHAVRFTDNEKAFELAKKAGEIADKINFQRGKAQSLRLIGIYYAKKANYHRALEYYRRALRIGEQLGDKRIKSDCLNSIGIIYSDQGNDSAALDYYEKALVLFKDLNDLESISYALNNIGVIYFDRQKYYKALDYFKESTEIDRQMGNRGGVAIGLNNIGEVYRDLGGYDQALDYFKQSLKISKEINDVYGISYLYKDFGSVYLRIKDYTKALDYSLKSLRIARQIDYNEIKKDVYLQLAKIYEHLNNYKKAYETYVLYKELSDSLFNEEKIKKILGIEYQYKLEKERQAIELEQQKKEAIRAETNKRQKIIRNALIAGVIFLIILSIVIIRSYLQKSKTNKLLSAKNESIEKKSKQVHEQNEEIQQLYEELTSTNEVLYVQNEELEKHRNNLEDLVKERTSELEKAKEKAEESDRLKSAFLANMSHEIRTPLNAILGFADLLSDEEIPAETKNEISGHLNHSADTLLKLIDDIFDIAKIESGQLAINKSSITAAEIFDKLIPMYGEKTKENVQLKFSKTHDNITIHTDALRLQQVLINLIDNALKFTEKGLVEVGYYPEKENDKNHIVFYVEDTGIGMNDRQLKIIFNRFSKIEENKAKIYRGAGLGLTISKNLVELLGGKIWVESRYGRGSKFSLSIPLDK